MDLQQAIAFCDALFGNEMLAEEDLQIEIMGLGPKTDPDPKKAPRPYYTFCKTPQAAAEAAVKISDKGHNAYFCNSLIDPKNKKGKRGTAKDAKAIVGFWSDIDIQTPDAPHKKNIPTSVSEAIKIANGTGARPSLIIHSGHGLHCYWLFKQPWIFQDDSERDYAADVARSWHQTVQWSAQQHGRVIDSVFDLARVLRVPGTWNNKIPALPLPVKVFVPPTSQFHRLQKHARPKLMSMVKAPPEESIGAQVDPIKLDNIELRAPNPEERQHIISAVQIRSALDARFKTTWERKRADFAKGDYSASAYDQSIANQLTAGNTPDQEILFALYIWREINGENPEKVINRPDYVKSTLTNAKSQNSRTVAIQTIAQISTNVENRAKLAPEVQAQIPEQQVVQERNTGLQAVSDLMGKEVAGLEQDGKENSNYYLVFADGMKIMVGKVTDLLDPRKAQAKVFERISHMIPDMKGPEWKQIIKLLVNFSAEARENPSLQPKDRIQGWLKHYLEGAPRLDDEPDEATRKKMHYALLRSSSPYFQNGHAAINAEAFRSWCYREYSDKPSKEEVAYVFDGLGAEKHRERLRYGEAQGQQTERQRPQVERRLWLIASDKVLPDDDNI